jgi:sodium/potassium-transporting ATPase subunit alpha
MPFNSIEKFALTIVELKTPNSDYCVYIKGAPEKIWNMCSEVQNKNVTEKKSAEWEKNFLAANK